MKKKKEHNTYALCAGLLTGLIVLWIIMTAGCSSVSYNKPLYGPHTTTTLTNHELDIMLRNAYSDGWQDNTKAHAR